jgi:hypothetical protein
MPRTAHRGLGTRLAARPALEPVPGWYLGFGQSANIATRFRKKSTSADGFALLTQHGYRFFGFAVDTALSTPLEPRKRFDSQNIIAVSGDSLP